MNLQLMHVWKWNQNPKGETQTCTAFWKRGARPGGHVRLKLRSWRPSPADDSPSTFSWGANLPIFLGMQDDEPWRFIAPVLANERLTDRLTSCSEKHTVSRLEGIKRCKVCFWQYFLCAAHMLSRGFRPATVWNNICWIGPLPQRVPECVKKRYVIPIVLHTHVFRGLSFCSTWGPATSFYCSRREGSTGTDEGFSSKSVVEVERARRSKKGLLDQWKTGCGFVLCRYCM